MSHDELVEDLRSEGIAGFVGRLGIVVGMICLAAALLSFVLRRRRKPPT